MRKISGEVIFLLFITLLCLVLGVFGFANAIRSGISFELLNFEWFYPIQVKVLLNGPVALLGFGFFFLSISYLGLRKNKDEVKTDLPLALGIFGSLQSWSSTSPFWSLIGVLVSWFSAALFLTRSSQATTYDRSLVHSYSWTGIVALILMGLALSWETSFSSSLLLLVGGLLFTRTYPFSRWIFEPSNTHSIERAVVLGLMPAVTVAGVFAQSTFDPALKDSLMPVIWIYTALFIFHQLSTISCTNPQRILESGQGTALGFGLIFSLWVGSFPALILIFTFGVATWVMGHILGKSVQKIESWHLLVLILAAGSALGFPLFSSHLAYAHAIQFLLPTPGLCASLLILCFVSLLHFPVVMNQAVRAGDSKKSKNKSYKNFTWSSIPLLPMTAFIGMGVLFGGWKDLEIARWYSDHSLLFKDEKLLLLLNEQSALLGGFLTFLVVQFTLGWFLSAPEVASALKNRMEIILGLDDVFKKLTPFFTKASLKLENFMSAHFLENRIEHPISRALHNGSALIISVTDFFEKFFSRAGVWIIQKMDQTAMQIQNGDIQRYLLFSIFASALMALILLGMR